MLNNIQIHGRLTKDPEMRQTQSGVSVCNFTVAVDRNYTRQGEDRQTDFFDCVGWRGLADMICKYFNKGKEIVLSGEMQSRKWQDKDGNNRTSWEIQVGNVDFCGSKGNGNSEPAYSEPDFGPADNEEVPFGPADNEEVPF